MLSFGMRSLHARPDFNKNPPSPNGHESDQFNGLGLRVTIRFIEIPMLALLRSSIHSSRPAKSRPVSLIQLFLFVLELLAAGSQVRKCRASGIT